MLAGKEELLDPEFTIGEADRALLGLGFSLRLVNGLVGIAGGGLEIEDDRFTLSVPLARTGVTPVGPAGVRTRDQAVMSGRLYH